MRADEYLKLIRQMIGQAIIAVGYENARPLIEHLTKLYFEVRRECDDTQVD